MSYPKLLLGIFVLFLFISCKSNIEPNSPYIGFWDGSGDGASYEIVISSNGDGSWNKYKGITYSSATGPVRVKNGKLKIGIKKLKIDQGPTLVQDQGYEYYTMKLDGIDYIRY